MRTHAIAAELPDAGALLRAARIIRAAGVRHWDVYSPYPIAGMDEAMGLAASPLGRLAFFGGLAGFLGATSLQFATTAFLYPLDAGGMPNGIQSLPVLFPIIFESTILAAALITVFGMFLLSRLPRLHHPLFDWHRFRGVSNDKFFLVLETGDPNYSEQALRELLASCGGAQISPVYEDE